LQTGLHDLVHDHLGESQSVQYVSVPLLGYLALGDSLSSWLAGNDCLHLLLWLWLRLWLDTLFPVLARAERMVAYLHDRFLRMQLIAFFSVLAIAVLEIFANLIDFWVHLLLV